ncbi:MAG: ChaN family lipoprotein [Phycisphaerales bacterium]
MMVLLAGLVLSGCASRRAPGVFDGHTGKGMSWNAFYASLEQADVVLLGEEHNDADGHALQTRIVEHFASREGSRLAVSLEMLERPDQPHVDAWLRDEITTDAMIEATQSTAWQNWSAWYQPVLDAAHRHNATIIAANAPRELVRLARTDGYDALAQRSAEEQQWFALPSGVATDSGYQERFHALMAESMQPEPAPGASASAANNPHAHGMSPDMIDGMFRAQLVWDATMADSIARALAEPGISRVIHLVGHFHSDFDGGTVLELRANPRVTQALRIVTVCMLGREGDALDPEDVGRADIVIYSDSAGP